MTDIILGTNFKLYYNTDTGNTSPQGIDNVLINELAAFPILSLTSEITSFDTYDSDYISQLLSDKSMSDINIIVNYIATNPTHQFLDEAALNQTEFQLVLIYYFDTEARQISYAIVNGYISASSLTGDEDSVVQKNYNFTHSAVIARSMVANARLPLYEGDFGVGSDGIDIDQYSPDIPTGNSFIKIPAAQSGNPASADMMGIGWTDNGQVCEFAVTKSGALGIYAKNASTAWTRIYTVTQSDAAYVPMARTVNGKALSANIILTKADVGLSTVTDNPQLKIASNLSDLANVATARTNLGLGSAAIQNIGTSGASIPLMSASNTWSGVQTFVGRTFITNLASTTAGTYNGTANVTQGVTGILPVASGGTGSTIPLDAARALSVVPIMQVFSDADVNTIVTAGVYSVTSISPNIPAAITGTMEVYVRQGGLSITQIYHCNATSAGFMNRHYIRTGTTVSGTTTWTNWDAMTQTTTNMATGTDLNTVTGAGRYYGSFVNSPSGTGNSASAIVDVTNTGSSSVIFQTLSFTTANTTWTRNYTGTDWTGWSMSYSSTNKPSALDIGALPLVGGTITGKTTFNNNVQVVTLTGNAAVSPAGTEVNVFYSGNNALAIGDTKQATLIRGAGVLTHGSDTGTYSVYTTGNKPSATDTGALPITGGSLIGATGLTVSGGAVTSRENIVKYRQLLSRTDAFSPYTTYNRTDQIEGTAATKLTSVGDIIGRLTTTAGDPYGRVLGGISFLHNTDNGGRTTISASNVTGAISSMISLDAATATATVTGTLQTAQVSATGTIERIGNGTLSFNANRNNSAVNSFYGAQTTAGQVFFGNASGNNFVVNNTQSNTGAWLTIDASSAAFSTAVTAPSLALTAALPLTSGGTGNTTGVATNVSGVVAIANGGTGATTAAAARNALAITPANIGALPVSGGTMAGTVNSSTTGVGFIKLASGVSGQINNFANIYFNSTQYMQLDLINNGSNVISRIVTWNGSFHAFGFYDNGNGVCDGTWISGSDERHKNNIKLVPNALDAVLSWRGVTYDKKDGLPEVGLIAQDIEKDCPVAVINSGERKFSDGTKIEDFKSLNVAGVSAAYHTEAIKELHVMILDLQAQIEKITNK